MGRVASRDNEVRDLNPFSHLHRYEDYVDQHYKEFLKNQGKVDSVRLAELAGNRIQGQGWRGS